MMSKTMGLGSDAEVNKLPRGNHRLEQTPSLISSLNEAWFHTLDRCVIDTTLSEAIFPLMRACFFGGALYAVLAAAGSWQSAGFRYCWLHHERAAVVTP